MRNRLLTVISFVLILQNVAGQTPSANQAKKTFFDQQKHDTLRVDAAIQLADNIYGSNLDSALRLIEKAHEWSKRSNYKKGLSITEGYLGFIFHTKGDYNRGIDYYQKSIAFNRQNNFPLNLAMDLGNYGSLLEDLSDSKAITCFQESIEIYKKYNRADDIAQLYSYIGNDFEQRKELDSAVHYYQLGLDYVVLQDTKALLFRQLSEAYFYQEKFDKALNLANDALLLSRENKSMMGIKRALITKAQICFTTKQFDIAWKCITELETMREVDINSMVTLAYIEIKAKLEFHFGNYKEAYASINSANDIREELFTEELVDIVKRKSLEFEYQEKITNDSIKSLEENEIRELKYERKLKAEETSKYILLGSILSLLIIVGLITRSYFKNRKNTKIIEEQNTALGLKNEEIIDSINYAKRIQSVILPSSSEMTEAFPKSFVYNRPKSIIGGDFYWLFKKDNIHLLAVADCTGHGVPGALLSVICSEALNRAVGEFKLEDPASILNKVRELIKDHLMHSNEELHDGMDISLVALDRNNTSQEGQEICFSGANSSIFVKTSKGIELLRGDRQPIGKYINESSFQNFRIRLQKDDMVFLSTDGYYDQFGGPDGKKMKVKPFLTFLQSIDADSISSYESLIVKHFEDWMASEEQVDDVCILGFQID